VLPVAGDVMPAEWVAIGRAGTHPTRRYAEAVIFSNIRTNEEIAVVSSGNSSVDVYVAETERSEI